MRKTDILYTKPLKEQIYDYLREEIRKQNLQPGSAINVDATSRKLGISKTPLRDALIQLEMDGFVTVAPRRGIFVNRLTVEDIRHFYQIIGALEHTALTSATTAVLLKPSHITRMQRLNDDMKKALDADNFNLFYKKNLEFHDTYIKADSNQTLMKIIDNLKRRLYDFPCRSEWVKEWEEHSILEHHHLLGLLEDGQHTAAADYIRDVHWSFQVQEKYITKYYFNGNTST